MMKFLLFYVLINIIVFIITMFIVGANYGILLYKASIKYDLEFAFDSYEEFATFMDTNVSYMDSFHGGLRILRIWELGSNCKYDVLRIIRKVICTITGINTIVMIYDFHKMSKHFDSFIEFLLKEAEKESQNEESE